jgi:hypothetical protein
VTLVVDEDALDRACSDIETEDGAARSGAP